MTRNEQLRSERGWDGLLAPAPELTRRAWATDDLAVAGLAGAVGFAGAWFDAPIQSWTRSRLLALEHTELIRRWKREAKNLAIDYTGPFFGGPGHRVRSAGHDLLRPVAALRQIRTGVFEGVRWEDGRRIREAIPHGVPVPSLDDALAAWLKHLVTDVITDRSLPVPGWSWLYELPVRDARKLAHDVYQGATDAPGLTVRRTATRSLPVLSTEVIVRGHVHGRAFHERGTVVLTAEERALRDEMLLVAHGLVGAASLGRTLATALTGSGPLALCHVDTQVLLRIGRLGWTVAGNRAERLPEWADLLECLEAPWDLELATEIDAAAGDTLLTE